MKINFSVLREKRESGFFVLDVFMVILVLINLLWISLDWFFMSKTLQSFLAEYASVFFQFYKENIHEDFMLFDAFFVTIFITEFVVRWAVAIKRKTYPSWFIFPFIHWYDVLGCIPLGTFRFLRLFRLISMTIRLQKLGVIDITGFYLWKLFKKYYEILVEEVSDRVVVNVISGMQEEIKLGSPVAGKIIREVIYPHKKDLAEWVSHRIKNTAGHHYSLYRTDIKKYIEQHVEEAVNKNKEMKELSAIPVIGTTIKNSVQSAVADITFNVIDSMLTDLTAGNDNKIIEEVTDISLEAFLIREEDEKLNRIITQISVQSLEAIKDQVKVQQWKEKDLQS
jgi:hypothetical protein